MKRDNEAISETVGTILLLGITITLFSFIYLSIITIYPISTSPSINLICSEEENNIIIEHRGGKTLELDTKIIVTINDTSKNFTVYDYLNNESRDNGMWNIGEQVVYPVGDIKDKRVSLSVIDVHSNSMIMRLELKE